MDNELSQQELDMIEAMRSDLGYQLDGLNQTVDSYLNAAHKALNDALEAMDEYVELGAYDESRARSLESLLIILEAEMSRYEPKDDGRSLEDLS